MTEQSHEPDVQRPVDDEAAVPPSAEADSLPVPAGEDRAQPDPPAPATTREAPDPDQQSCADGIDDPIAPHSLRVDPRVAAELFGALYTGITTYGSAAFGDHNTINNNFGPLEPTPTIEAVPGMPDLEAVYAPSAADDPLDKLLGERSAICLTGPKNSGRFSTACMALARRHGVSAVHEVLLPAGMRPESLAGEAERIEDNHGYVLRLSGENHIEALRKLTGLFHRRSASLVLIKDEGARDRDRHGAEITHCPPDPVEVFLRHLSWRLHKDHELSPATCTGIADGHAHNPKLRSELIQVYSPRESVAVAHAVSKRHPVDAAGLEAVVAESQPRRRTKAAAILLPPDGEPRARRHRAGQHERAFRIAYAVFRQQPLHYVFEAAGWLLEEIDDAARRPEWGCMALEHPVQDLLGPELKADWLAGRDARNAALGSSRVAWIRDAGLRGAIIDVAWHDFDSTRRSLLRWLDRMVRQGDRTMSRAGAETAALLVHHDFDRVHRELVDRWAASPSPRVRQAAAWTETIADLAGDVRPLVREKLNQWCSGASNYQRDTAARLYASGLQQPLPQWSVADLRRIAGDPMQLRSQAVAEGINQLYRPQLAGWLIAVLALWTRNASVRIHAARALLALAARPATGEIDGRPELLVRISEGSVASAELATLWRAALIEPALSRAAWTAFARWLSHADLDVSMRETADALTQDVLDRPALRRRAAFYLQRDQEFRGGLPEWIARTLA